MSRRKDCGPCPEGIWNTKLDLRDSGALRSRPGGAEVPEEDEDEDEDEENEERSVVSVACVEAGSELGFSNRFEGGIVTVRIEAVVYVRRERRERRRRMKGEDRGGCMIARDDREHK